jgi:hypothetical protein
MNGTGHSFPPNRLSRRAKQDLAVGLSGLVWVTLTLLLTLSSPAISLFFAVLAGYELLAGHRAT